nr:hypothetical protein CFP56_26384 [Quercus suber]
MDTQAKLNEEPCLRKEAEKVSQPFFDACGIYYGDEFDGCLKKVGAPYLDLDLSQIVINNTVPPAPGGDESLSDESDDSIHIVEQEVKDNGVVIAQPVPEGLVTPTVSSTIDPSFEGGPNIVNLAVSNFPPS